MQSADFFHNYVVKLTQSQVCKKYLKLLWIVICSARKRRHRFLAVTRIKNSWCGNHGGERVELLNEVKGKGGKFELKTKRLTGSSEKAEKCDLSSKRGIPTKVWQDSFWCFLEFYLKFNYQRAPLTWSERAVKYAGRTVHFILILLPQKIHLATASSHWCWSAEQRCCLQEKNTCFFLLLPAPPFQQI